MLSTANDIFFFAIPIKDIFEKKPGGVPTEM